MRPPARRNLRSRTAKNTLVCLDTISSVVASDEKGTPASIWRTASMTTMPAEMPMPLVSTTSTGKSSIVRATMRTVSQVADKPEEMLTKTAEV